MRIGLYLLALFAPVPAQAICTAAAGYGFEFASRPAAQLAYGTTYNHTAVNGTGQTRPFTVALAQNGLTSTAVAGQTMPNIGTLMTGPDATRRNLVLGGIFGGRTPDVAGTTRVITVTFTFTVPVRDFVTTLNDVDFNLNQFRDIIQVTGSANGQTYTPTLLTPHGNGNGTAPRNATASSATFGPVTGITASQARGVGEAGNNSSTGTISASFAQPVTSVTFRYGNAPLQTGETVTGQQAIGIAGLTFCPMPEITVAKSSAPATDTGGRATPGGDMIYTLTVVNAGASPVDAGTIVLADILPTGVVFRNQTFDAGTPGAVRLDANASGVTIPASAIAYSNNGTTFTYTPASGYDAAVRGLRITPVGAMAASSSFSLQFRVRLP